MDKNVSLCTKNKNLADSDLETCKFTNAKVTKGYIFGEIEASKNGNYLYSVWCISDLGFLYWIPRTELSSIKNNDRTWRQIQIKNI